MTAAGMRKLAEQLRVEADRRAVARTEKCAKIVTAASGLDHLRRKLAGGRHGS